MTSTTSPTVGAVVAAAEDKGARVGLSVILPDGASINHRENEVFTSASTIKIAIMVQLFDRIEAGDLHPDQRHRLKQEDKAAGNGVLKDLHTGIELTLRDLLYLMMSISDNSATNILIGHLGMGAVNATMRELGLQESLLGRRMCGRPADPGEQENLATPAEFAHLMAAIVGGTAASAQSCAAMQEMLKLQANDRRIGRFVPAGMQWGSKTGTYGTVVNDVGFIATEDGPLIISIFAEDVADVVTGEAIISEVVRELLA